LRQLDTFPRYNVLKAIREAIESSIPQDFRSSDELTVFLLSTAQSANDPSTKSGGHPNTASNETHDRAIQEERDLFCGFIEEVSEAQLSGVKPLPYRRSLTMGESETLRARLKERWDWDGANWYPDAANEVRGYLLALQERHFHTEVSHLTLQAILRRHGMNHLFVIRGEGPDLEIAIELMDLNESGAFWVSGELDWVVYVSHESSITFGGDWLIQEMKEAWPTWERRIWTDYYYD
jgi:hypothetical protein